MRKLILIHTVPMYQSTSGLMEQTCVHRNALNIRMKGRLPYIPGHHPWRKELRNVLQGEECQTPMFVIQMTLAVTDGALPNRAPLDRANATIVRAPDGNLSYERPSPIRSSLHIWGNTPARCVETPGLADDSPVSSSL